MRPVLIAALALAACTHRHHMADLSTGTHVTVETEDGHEVEAVVAAHPTQIVFVDRSGNVIPTQRVARAVDVRRGRGALDGALALGLTGVVVGAAIGYSDGDDECSSFCILTFTAGEKAAFAGTAFGVVGASAGAIAGAIIGSRDVYTFGDGSEVRVAPGGPPGSTAGMTVTF